MSEWPPPVVAGNTADDSQKVLTPEAIEAALSDFRSWLGQRAAAPADGAPAVGEDHEESIDLHTLLGQFIALRHEVNLQTKAARAQQEQNGEALRQLGEALAALQDKQASEAQALGRAQEEMLRPLLKTLVDVYDALSLAGREAQRLHGVVVASLEKLIAAELAVGEGKLAGLAGWLLRGQLERYQAGQQDRRWLLQQTSGSVRQMLDSLVTGYTMGLRRVERALEQYHLEPIPTVGRPFDPELMEVLEVATGTDRPAGEVVEEVRRGYLWNGRLFRYAQVRVAK